MDHIPWMNSVDYVNLKSILWDRHSGSHSVDEFRGLRDSEIVSIVYSWIDSVDHSVGDPNCRLVVGFRRIYQFGVHVGHNT
jgi:hypothetical protein